MTQPTPDIIRAALASIAAPDGRGSLARSSALSDIVIEHGRVSFAITVAPEQAEAAEALRRAAEEAVRALPGVTEVLVALTAERPAPPLPSPPKPRAVPGVRHIIAVASGKGGVGKSTTAANLALALAARGLRIGLLDADIYGPSLPTLFNLHDKPEAEGHMLMPLRAQGLVVMSIGFMIPQDTAIVWRGPMVMKAIRQMLHEVAWGELDVLVVDMPPGTGDAQLTLAQQVPLSGAVIVSTPQDLALADARRGVSMFQRMEVPVLGVVENMSLYCCPNCGHTAPLFGHGGARAEAARLGVPFLGEVPLDLRIRELSDAGTPIVAAAPESPQAQVYREIAAGVMAALTL